MDQFLTDLDKLLNQFGVQGVSFSTSDPLLVITFFLSLFAFFLGILSYIKSARQKGKAEVPRAAMQRIEDLTVKIDDLRVIRSELESRLAKLEDSHGIEKKKTSLDSNSDQAGASSLDTGLRKTRNSFVGKLRALLGDSSAIKPETLAGLEELLVSSDIGIKTTQVLLDELKQLIAGSNISSDEAIKLLRSKIEQILADSTNARLSCAKVGNKPRVILFVGVNGVGKTTTIGKIAQQFQNSGAKVLLGACDTFRAAAVEQLTIWSKRSGVEIVAGEEGAKPTTVAYQAIHRGIGEGYDVVLIDTAGRLHTRKNLMSELIGIRAIIERELPGAPHDVILVVDATTGQNALQQAKQFHEAVDLSGVVVTKLDGTPKGGIIVAIRQELGIPIRYIGIGEGIDDLKIFNAKEFCDSLFEGSAMDQINESETKSGPASRTRARRRRRDSKAAQP